MKILTIDVGGSNIKFLLQGEESSRRFPSGPLMTAQGMVVGVKEATTDWQYDVVSIGYPGPVLHGQPVTEPLRKLASRFSEKEIESEEKKKSPLGFLDKLKGK